MKKKTTKRIDIIVLTVYLLLNIFFLLSTTEIPLVVLKLINVAGLILTLWYFSRILNKE